MSEFWFKVGVVFIALLMLYDYYFNKSENTDAFFAYMSFLTGISDTYEPQPNRNKTTPPPAPAQQTPAQQTPAQQTPAQQTPAQQTPAQASVTAKSSMDVVTTTPKGAQASFDALNKGAIERASACEGFNKLKILLLPLILLAIATISLVNKLVPGENDDMSSHITCGF